MKAARLIILVVIAAIVAGVVVWRVGVYTPRPATQGPGLQVKAGDEPNEPNKPDHAEKGAEGKPADANKGAEGEKPGEGEEGKKAEKPADVNEPNEPNEPNDPMENINVKDMEMKDVIAKIAEWTDKNIIPCDEVMGQKITIYAPKKVPRSRALALMFSALRAKKFVAEYVNDTIYLKPLAQAKLLSVPMIPADVPLASIENKELMAQKFFQLKNYGPSQMANIIVPLIDEYGYVSADESTGKLLVIDTVENLIRISRVIDQFDIPEAGQVEMEVFEIKDGDPAEIVQVLRILMGGEQRGASRPDRRSDRDSRRDSDRRREREERDRRQSGGEAISVAVGPSGAPVKLIPVPQRKWIIAQASPEDMKQIRQWIVRLDTREDVQPEHETVVVRFADVGEVADRLNEVLQRMPGRELQMSVLVQPLQQAGQIVIYGRQDMREMVKRLIEEIDIPTGLETKVFQLKHADPEQIKQNIDDLFGEGEEGYRGYYYWRYRSERSPSDIVKVIAFPTMQQVTVIASPEKMVKIDAQIKEWDAPLDVEKVKPLIITLKNTDPVKMAALLSGLFTEETESSRPWWWWDDDETKKKIVGPLYGQLTFENVPGTKKIVVISKIPEAYRIIKEFISELDKQEPAEVPTVVTLKYADSEDLAERLNAIFNEPGTTAKIRLSESGLSAYSMEETEGNQGDGDGEATSPGEYTPWWSGARRLPDEMPISNVIGRIRFIPDPRTKSIMVLSPPEFIKSIVKMIEELDVPGMQVRVKAIILEIDHRDLTSLGVQLASNPASFGTIDEDAVVALTALTHLSTHGSLTLSSDAPLGAEGTSGTVAGVGINVTALIDFLVKRVDAKILNQQTLWTKDNEEADFFKGQRVAFLGASTLSAETGSTRQDITFEKVGMTLRVRPNITPEKNVAMTINMVISQLTTDVINSQRVRTEMDTETTLIVQDGETIMLGGMLFQEDSNIERKIPLLGDLPLLGGLFRHNEIVKANTEMLVFVTPYVIDEDPSKMLPETREQLQQERQRLQRVMKELQASISGKEKTSDKPAEQ